MSYRMGNTAREIVAAGDFVKVGKKHYRHVSGVEIKYNWTRWAWELPDGRAWTLLWVAVHEVRRENVNAWTAADAVPV